MDSVMTLIEYGLSEKEARIYLHTLHNSSCTAAHIAKTLNLQRRTIYDILEILKNKQLVTELQQRGIKHYQANNPSLLLETLKRKETLVKKIMPDLQKAFKEIERAEPSFNVLTGAQGFKKIVEEMVVPGSEFVMFGRGGVTLDYLRDAQYQYVPKLKQTKWRSIQIPTKVVNEYYKKFSKKQLENLKIIPGNYKLPGAFMVAKDTTYLMFPYRSEEHYVLEIRDKDIATTFLSYFDIVWNLLDKNCKKKYRKTHKTNGGKE